MTDPLDVYLAALERKGGSRHCVTSPKAGSKSGAAVRYRITLIGSDVINLRGHAETGDALNELADAVQPLGWIVLASPAKEQP